MKDYHILITEGTTEYALHIPDGNDLCVDNPISDTTWECTWGNGDLDDSYQFIESFDIEDAYTVSIYTIPKYTESEDSELCYNDTLQPPYDITVELLEAWDEYQIWEDNDDSVPEGKEELYTQLSGIRDRIIDYLNSDWTIIDILIVNTLINSSLVEIQEDYDKNAYGK